MVGGICLLFLLATVPYGLFALGHLDIVNININIDEGTNTGVSDQTNSTSDYVGKSEDGNTNGNGNEGSYKKNGYKIYKRSQRQRQKYSAFRQKWRQRYSALIDKMKNKYRYRYDPKGQLFGTSNGNDKRIKQMDDVRNQIQIHYRNKFKNIVKQPQPLLGQPPELSPPVCKHHVYKNWFELISPCFKQLVGKGSTNGRVCSPNKIQGNHLLAIHKAVNKLEHSIANDKKLAQQSELMWKAVQSQPFREWCPGNFQEMLRYLKIVLTLAPQYLPNTPNFYEVPVTNVLLCYLHTQEGRRFFASPPVNAAMVDIVNRYAKFLESKESLYVLNSGIFGWKSLCALKALNYMQDFVYNKADKYWGFKSWNDFFTRRLKKGARPIYQKYNNKVMNAVGDIGYVHMEMDLKNTTKLWIKNEEYSLFQMFDKNPVISDKFIGGTAMQFFFSPTKYHHYHAPMSGKVVYAVNKHGIMYAIDEVNVMKDRAKLTTFEGWLKYGINGVLETELYMAHVASRAIVVIENDLLGPVAVFFIGMNEISSCLIDPRIKKGFEEGNPVYVEKGEHLGNFQYGGSSGLILLTKKVVQMKNKPF